MKKQHKVLNLDTAHKRKVEVESEIIAHQKTLMNTKNKTRLSDIVYLKDRLKTLQRELKKLKEADAIEDGFTK